LPELQKEIPQKGMTSEESIANDEWTTVERKAHDLGKKSSSLSAAVTKQSSSFQSPPRTFSNRKSQAQQQQQQQQQRKGQARSKSFMGVSRSQSKTLQRNHSSVTSSSTAPLAQPQHANHSNNNNTAAASGVSSSLKSSARPKVPARSQSYSVTSSTSTTTTSTAKKKATFAALPSSVTSANAEAALLYQQTGCGTTKEEQAVIRRSSDFLLSHRLTYLDPPQRWTPHEKCQWTAHDRIQSIQLEQAKVFNFKPLQVNEQTRWKPKVQQQTNRNNHPQSNKEEEEDHTQQLQTIQGILNKLSWTNIDKLTLKFVETLGVGQDHVISPQLLHTSMKLVVEKAMTEPHFAELYARLSTKLSDVHRAFKRTILGICQEEFEATESEDKNDHADLTPAEKASADRLARKKSIGLMKYIGELYVMKLIKVQIMISCLERLLVHDDEEKLECFCKLMTTIGKQLDNEGEQDAIQHIWDEVYGLAGLSGTAATSAHSTKDVSSNSSTKPLAPSTRLRFLLKDLIELKENDWVQIRHVHETAKTIDQIHKQAALEAKLGPSVSTSQLRRSQSSGGSGFAGASPVPMTPKKNIQRTRSYDAVSDGFPTASPAIRTTPRKPNKKNLRRVKSEVNTPNTLNSSLQQNLVPSRRNRSSSASSNGEDEDGLAVPQSTLQSSPSTVPPPSSNQKPYDPKVCGEKTKAILNEYFVGGDLNEAVALIQELVNGGAGTGLVEGRVERGAAIIEGGVLMVLEMKESQVQKFLELIIQCCLSKIINRESLILGLRDPLEFLRDIEIDAPRAGEFLAQIIANWLMIPSSPSSSENGNAKILGLGSLDFLLSAPDYFRTDGRPATFAAQILKYHGGTVTDEDVQIISQLMSDDEKNTHGSARKFLESIGF
jgi:translation initiation factor 4G